MQALHATSRAVLVELKAVRIIALVLARCIRPLLALGACELQRGSVLCLRHLLLGDLRDRAGANGAAAFANREALTTSMAIGVMSSTVISTLSPGMIISAPAGRPIDPVTSVVRR